MRLRLHRELERSGSLADPGVLEMARRLDCLIVEEMKKTLPKESSGGPGRVE